MNAEIFICRDHRFHEQLQAEVMRARKLHNGPYDAHHAYSIILEELDEFWDEVRKKQHDRPAMRVELLHIAAMAQRAATELFGKEGEL